jgi:hypothetical protein
MNPASTDAAGSPGGEPVIGEQHDRQPPACYHIRIRGHLGAAMRRAFPALQAPHRGRSRCSSRTPRSSSSAAAVRPAQDRLAVADRRLHVQPPATGSIVAPRHHRSARPGSNDQPEALFPPRPTACCRPPVNAAGRVLACHAATASWTWAGSAEESPGRREGSRPCRRTRSPRCTAGSIPAQGERRQCGRLRGPGGQPAGTGVGVNTWRTSGLWLQL